MNNQATLKITPVGEKELTMTRVFDADRALLFDAFTKPELIKRWLLGPPGWTMPVCDVDLKVGGNYRYVWRHSSGDEMGMGGTYKEIKKPDSAIHTEKFDQPWYPGESTITTTLVEKNGQTTYTATISYESKAARDAVFNSDMQSGVAASYDRLAQLLNELW